MVPWAHRLSQSEKRAIAIVDERKRKILHPTRKELQGKGNVSSYVQRRKLNNRVEKTIDALVHENKFIVDHRDLRMVHKSDRVPRSLEPEATFSEHYWLIDHGFEELFQKKKNS